ncbi:MAG: hydrogenase maturation protease [Rhodospirillales bacterium]|nr:hydrogenase maturation protease [Rhodospirillales bacterium]
MKYLLIGYGNPMRSDDGVGPHVAAAFEAEAAQRLGAEAANLEVISTHQLLPELAESFVRVDRVVLVDASSGELPGEFSVRRVEPAPDASETMIHAYDPSTLAAWAAKLYGKCPEIHVIAIGAMNFGFGQGLSPDVTETIPAVLDEIAGLFSGGDAEGAA